MNKVVNVFSLAVLAIFTVMCLIIVYDLSISNYHLKGLPFKKEILSGLALILFLIGMIRVRRRWQGIKDMNRFKQFDFDAHVSKSLMKRVTMFTLLEILFLLATLYLFYQLYLIEPELLIVMMAVLAILCLEMLVFLIKILQAGRSFRIGINDKVIAYFGREMQLFFYAGLRRVELHQRDLISFTYKDDMVLFFPATILKKEDRIPFRKILLEKLEQKNIYFDDALRTWE